jgi:hypothetical protein
MMQPQRLANARVSARATMMRYRASWDRRNAAAHA